MRKPSRFSQNHQGAKAQKKSDVEEIDSAQREKDSGCKIHFHLVSCILHLVLLFKLPQSIQPVH